MQALVPPVGDRNPNGHIEGTILAALQGRDGARRLSFRYYLREAGGSLIETLDNVTAGTVSQNWLADIKRTATFTMRETGGIDFLSDRIQPAVRLHLPPYGDDDFVEWPQGVFLLTTPKRSASGSGVVTREVQGYDQLQVYSDDLLADRYSVATGAVVTTAVTTVLNSVLVAPAAVVVPHSGTLTAAKEWEPGTSKLRIINDLLGMINYESLSFDEDGVAQVRPYRPLSERAEEYAYLEGQSGLVLPDPEEELDLFNVANRWVMVVSEPDQPVLTSVYTNADPSSPTSTIRRQRTLTDYRTEQEATDQVVLDLKVQRLAEEASQIYQSIDFRTALMPIHSGNDVYRLQISSLAVNAAYLESSWKLTMRAGAPMEHVARRVVLV